MAEQSEGLGAIGAVSAMDSALRDAPSNPPPAPPASPRGSAPPATSPSPSRGPASGSQSSPKSLEEAVAQINTVLASVDRIMQLRVDPVTGITVATISNAATGEVLQQIPSGDLIRLAQMLQSWAGGKNVLVDLIA